ncbi:MAG: cation transporter [Gammaproteobacteria bacterium]|nr:cation transporter [Gammaproteobacteria bacterium]
MMRNQQRYQRAKQITLIGAGLNFLLGIIKVFFGIVGNSKALLADGIHSFSDLITDFMVLFAAKTGSRLPDEEHPYGHGRIETMAAMALALVLIVVAIGIAADGFYSIFFHSIPKTPSIMTMVIALISAIVNEGLFQYTNRVGNEIRSDLLRTNAWHHRLDALSSFVVLIGIFGARVGWAKLDDVAAIIVAVFIIRMGIMMLWSSTKELIDTGLDKQPVQEILDRISQVDGVKSVHQLRTRLAGGAIFSDLHLQVDSWITVSEGHYIADQVYTELTNSGLDISDVLIHIDAEDDQHDSRTAKLPNRRAIEEQLTRCYSALPGAETIKKTNLHYLSGQIHVELILATSVLAQHSAETLTAQYRQAVKPIAEIVKLALYFSA